MKNSTSAQPAKLDQSLSQFLCNQHLTHFVTLVFNRYDMTLPSARRKLRHWHGHVDRALLGPNWSQKPSSARTLFYAFPEHIDTNLHFHLLARPAVSTRAVCFENAATVYWSELVRGGSIDIAPITQINGVVHYATKDTWRPRNFENFIISTEFIG